MSALRHSLASVRELRELRESLPVAAPAIVEISAVTPDERPCEVRYVEGGDVVSVWVPRFGDRPSMRLDTLALVAREWMQWARNEAARAEAYRGRS